LNSSDNFEEYWPVLKMPQVIAAIAPSSDPLLQLHKAQQSN
jgi:hypothetical protein